MTKRFVEAKRLLRQHLSASSEKVHRRRPQP
jgi:hypothetical protein